MARRRTIKEPVTRGKVTVREAREAASKNYRSASSGRYVTARPKKK